MSYQQTTFWLHNFDWLLYLSHFVITASAWKHAKDEVDSIAKASASLPTLSCMQAFWSTHTFPQVCQHARLQIYVFNWTLT